MKANIFLFEKITNVPYFDRAMNYLVEYIFPVHF